MKQNVIKERVLQIPEEKWRYFVEEIDSLFACAEQLAIFPPFVMEPNELITQLIIYLAEFFPHDSHILITDLFR